MAPPPAPFELEIVAQKLIKPRSAPSRQTSSTSDGSAVAAGSSAAAPMGRTELSAFDQINAVLATARAYGFASESALDPQALELAVEATVTDLPFLAGRLSRMQGRRLSSLAIEHTGEGALFTVVEADAVSLSAMAPHLWPQRRVALAGQDDLAFYMDCMDAGRRMLAGREPLMKVRLTQLKDGQILGITLSHVLLDGMRWPALEAHLGARYRQYATPGRPKPDPELLLQPADRRLLSAEHMAEELLGQGAAWTRPQHSIRGSLPGLWSLVRQAAASSKRNCELIMIHLPRPAAVELKTMAAEGNSVPGITTGDAVQAATSLLIHAAHARPLLPVAPKAMAVMVQVPAPKGYFGNAVRMMDVSLPAGTQQPAAGDAGGALRQLAGAIRLASAAFRAEPERALEAMAHTEALVHTPLLRMLCHMCGVLAPRLQSATNYNPKEQTIDMGVGPPVLTRQVSVPRARDIAIIRPAVAPYTEGLFIQLCMEPAAAERLRRLELLQALMPKATFVGQ